MADGQYRFHQVAGQQQFLSQFTNPRLQHPRPSSPTARRNLAADTPSPSRSPGRRSPSTNPYSMYNQNHGGINTHGMLNGAGHQRYGNQLNLNKPYNHHNPHQHNQHAQNGQESGQHPHQSNFISHQHNQSGGATGHFGTSHLQNGNQNGGFGHNAKTQSEHWQKQMEVASEVRGMTHAHPHARNASSASKSVLPGLGAGAVKDPKEIDGKYGFSRGEWIEDEVEKSPWTELDLGGSHLRCLSLELFDYYPFLTKLYLNNNRLDSIPTEIGKLRNLVHLDCSLNRIEVLPPEMGMLVKLRTLLLVDNKLQVIPFELGNLFNLQMLAVDGNPLNEEQLDLIVESGTQELVRQLREKAPAPPPPNDRDWVSLDDSPAARGEKFTAITFNILGPNLASAQQFGHAPSHVLEWEYRKQLILDEIVSRNADIVCLQELDMANYNDFFRENLARSDYKGVYWARTRATTMSHEQARSVDGCAIFFKNDKFIQLEKQMIALGQIATGRPDMKGESDVYNRVLNKDHIAIVILLENRYTGSRLIVSNTHLFWDPHFSDVKIVQTTSLVDEISRFADAWAKRGPTPDKDKIRFRFANNDTDGEGGEVAEAMEPVPSMSYERGTDIPMLVCGDFNSTPKSGVYEYLTTGQLAGNHKEFQTYSYAGITKNGVRHDLGLKSSHAAIGELPFTNYTHSFTGVLDYIFYSPATLSCTGFLGQVDEDYLKRIPGFPNQHYPSDHIVLYSEFKTKARKERRGATEADFGPQKENRRA